MATRAKRIQTSEMYDSEYKIEKGVVYQRPIGKKTSDSWLVVDFPPYVSENDRKDFDAEMKNLFGAKYVAKKYKDGGDILFGSSVGSGGSTLGGGRKFYWMKMDMKIINEYIGYASSMHGMFDGEIYTQEPNRVAFETNNDLFTFESMIENHNNDNGLEEGDKDYIDYEILFDGKPRMNIFDKISQDKYEDGGEMKPENVDLGEGFELIFNEDHSVDVEYKGNGRSLLVSYSRFENDGFSYEDDAPDVPDSVYEEVEQHEEAIQVWEDVDTYADGGGMPSKFDVDVSDIYFIIAFEWGNKPKDLTAEQVYEFVNKDYEFPKYSKKASEKALDIHNIETKKGGSMASGGLIFKKDVEIYRNEEPHNTFDIYEFDEAKEGSVTDERAKGDTMSGTILGKSKGHYILEDKHTPTLYYVPTNSVKQGKITSTYAGGGEIKSWLKDGTKVKWYDPEEEHRDLDKVWIIKDYDGQLAEILQEEDYEDFLDDIIINIEAGQSHAEVSISEIEPIAPKVSKKIKLTKAEKEAKLLSDAEKFLEKEYPDPHNIERLNNPHGSVKYNMIKSLEREFKNIGTYEAKGVSEKYMDKHSFKYAKGGSMASGGEITPVVGEIKVKITDEMGTFEDHVGYKKGTVLEVVGIDEDGFMSTKEDYRLDHNEVEFVNKDGYDNYIKSSKHLYDDSTYAGGGEIMFGSKWIKKGASPKTIYNIDNIDGDRIYFHSSRGTHYQRTRENFLKDYSKKGGSMASGGEINVHTKAKEMSSKEYDKLYSSLTDKEIKDFDSLVRLGDSKKLALATIVYQERIRPDNSEFYRKAYEYAGGGEIHGFTPKGITYRMADMPNGNVVITTKHRRTPLAMYDRSVEKWYLRQGKGVMSIDRNIWEKVGKDFKAQGIKYSLTGDEIFMNKALFEDGGSVKKSGYFTGALSFLNW